MAWKGSEMPVDRRILLGLTATGIAAAAPLRVTQIPKTLPKFLISGRVSRRGRLTGANPEVNGQGCDVGFPECAMSQASLNPC